MKFAVLLVTALMWRSAAQGVASPSVDAANKMSVVPVNSVEENQITINKTRYKLDNITTQGVGIGEAMTIVHVDADVTAWPDRMSLLHPNFWTYWIHTVFQFLAAIMALKCPKVLLVLLICAVLCWPISAIFNEPIWAMKPFASDWWLMCAKSMIVNIAPTAPMMLCLIHRPNKETCHRAGVWTYGILWANVAWTLCFLPMRFNAVSVTNGVCGISLCVSLIIHNVAVCRKGATLFEVKDDIIYGYGTSLSWLVCYTLWNALFVLELAVGLVLQDIAFWAMMIFFWYWSDCYRPIESYFAMARPISLSAFIATSDWPGLLEYWKGADPLGLNVTKHAFFLFLAVGNVLYSFYVLYWSICCYSECGGADKYFENTFASQKLDEDMDDYEEAEDEEASFE